MATTDATNGTVAPVPAQNGADDYKLRFATVCASNQNRYMVPSSIPTYLLLQC